MGSESGTTKVKVETGTGMIWFIGWLFTLAYAQLGLGQALLGVLIWPYYLGAVLR